MTEALSIQDRQQKIIEILRRESRAKVADLSDALGVTQVTIRSDLDLLEEDGFIERVRGGAILKEGYQIVTPSLAERARINESGKYRIARRAAELVSDGDVILLDDSTTAIAMVNKLKDRHNLTVVTNGVETALALSQTQQHTVILLGGVMHNNGSSVIGSITEMNLQQLHIQKAFLSCTGFSIDVGLTHKGLQDAQIKRHMLSAAHHVIALIDSSKFGKTDLTPFATLADIDTLLTDAPLDTQQVQALHEHDVSVTVCLETTTSTYSPAKPSQSHYRIGFANIGEDQSSFASDVRQGIERVVQSSTDIDLVSADNRFDAEVALNVADELIANRIDLAIEYQVNEQVGNLVASKFNLAQIPVIAVDIPMVGATYFGVDNYQAGYMAGIVLGEWIEAQWSGDFDYVLILQYEDAAPLPATRMRGQLEGLEKVVGSVPKDKQIMIEAGPTSDTYAEEVTQTLCHLPEDARVAVLTFNDHATMGAVEASRNLNRMNSFAIVGQGADRRVRAEIRDAYSPVIGATAFWPERYGERLIEIAKRILNGASVPPAVYIEHTFLDANNIDEFYEADNLAHD